MKAAFHHSANLQRLAGVMVEHTNSHNNSMDGGHFGDCGRGKNFLQLATAFQRGITVAKIFGLFFCKLKKKSQIGIVHITNSTN